MGCFFFGGGSAGYVCVVVGWGGGKCMCSLGCVWSGVQGLDPGGGDAGLNVRVR